ncbi:hypothetical protein Xen7305DRAFT_00006610 [Xenococcus sp. PCC 7305]|uniref:hypothetical protein n=1 Tax=Xenococcus sp. PCC 7305 TaxID=102125 RepID=UPI0002AC970D|nr:hypothetical protein [Xenococcus sp. PCC 7305]ELS00960.1 hypothetical protein Xen7305DRAFT_00006610 [Xenococcus sp. PCC 7305]
MFIDPILIQSAKRIYRTYCDSRAQVGRKPLGVALNKETLKGQLIFGERPILLPGECFININQMEAEVYP